MSSAPNVLPPDFFEKNKQSAPDVLPPDFDFGTGQQPSRQQQLQQTMVRLRAQNAKNEAMAQQQAHQDMLGHALMPALGPAGAAFGALGYKVQDIPKIASGFASDLYQAGKGIVQTAGPPQTAGDYASMLAGPSALPAKRMAQAYYQSVGQSQQQAQAAGQRGDVPGVVINSAAAGLPLVGPLVSGIYEQGGTPEAAGAGLSRSLQAASLAPEGSVIPNPLTGAIRAAMPKETALSTAPPKPSEAVQQTQALRAKAAASQATAAKAETLAASQDAATQALHENIQQTHANVKAGLDARWDSLREKVGDAPGNPDAIAKAETAAREKLANSTPQSQGLFDNILNKARDSLRAAKALGFKDVPTARLKTPPQVWDAVVKDSSAQLQEAAAQRAPDVQANSFNDLRNQYTQIGQQLSSGNLPGDVYQALKTYQGALDSEITRIARENGAGKQYLSLKSDWSQYMQDFHNTGGPLQKGSPLAKAVHADNPVYTGKQVTGPYGGQLTETLGKYSSQGGKPALSAKLQAIAAEAKALPKVKTVQLPQGIQNQLAAAKGKAVGSAKLSPVENVAAHGAGLVGGMVLHHPISGYYAGPIAFRALKGALTKR